MGLEGHSSAQGLQQGLQLHSPGRGSPDELSCLDLGEAKPCPRRVQGVPSAGRPDNVRNLHTLSLNTVAHDAAAVLTLQSRLLD